MTVFSERNFSKSEHQLGPPVGKELETAVGAGRRALERSVRQRGEVDGRRAVELRTGDRPPVWCEHPAAHRHFAGCLGRIGFGPRNGGLGISLQEDQGSRLRSSAGSCPSETRAADAPQVIRPAASKAADAKVSFWSNMILSTSRVNSLAPAETTPTVID